MGSIIKKGDIMIAYCGLDYRTLAPEAGLALEKLR